ncbi:hypothetical protein ACHAXR_002335 [Thalassiosira sp. AJA248-18]
MNADGDASQYRQQPETDSEVGDDGAGDQQGAICDDNGDDGIVTTPDMCHYCFDTLLKELLPESVHRNHGRSPKRKQTKKENIDDSTIDIDVIRNKLETQQTYTPPSVDCPLFVTWSKLRSSHPPPLLSAVSSSGLATPATESSSNITDEASTQHDDSDYDLRGCIGTLAPKPLKYALAEFAITSALHDQRFDPIAISELPFLRVGVSLLVKYEECKDCLDWQVGVHGIIIKFESMKKGKGREQQRTYSATYLPEVAYEQRWSQEEAVISLVRKAGYRGVISDDLLAQICCTRYQSSKYRLSYQEYAMARHQGIDPLKNVSIVTAAAVDEAMRQRVKASRPCVNL